MALVMAIAMGAAPAVRPTTRPHAAANGKRTLHAMVAGVDGRVLRVSILRKKSAVKERRIRVGPAAVVTLNSQAAKLSALKAGENVTIQMNHGVATKIDATGQ